MSKILIVEDEESIADLEKDYLELSGFEVEIENDGTKGLERALHEEFDLFILDLMLPGVDGFEICKKIREIKNTPILMVSAKKDDIDKIRGLGLGADDYVTKPFRIRELMARIKNVLRRRGRPDTEAIRLGNIWIYPAQARVMRGGQEVFLTALEYRLLLTFASNEGQTLTRGQLLESIWDAAGDFVNDNTLTVYIKRLREKLEDDPQKPQLIQTVRGLGYRAVGSAKNAEEHR